MLLFAHLKLASYSVTLHAKQLNFSSAKWVATGSATPAECDAEQISYHLKETTATLTFEDPLPAGHAQLIIEFTGILNNDMNGFYRSTYNSIDGMDYFFDILAAATHTVHKSAPSP